MLVSRRRGSHRPALWPAAFTEWLSYGRRYAHALQAAAPEPENPGEAYEAERPAIKTLPIVVRVGWRTADIFGRSHLNFCGADRLTIGSRLGGDAWPAWRKEAFRAHDLMSPRGASTTMLPGSGRGTLRAVVEYLMGRPRHLNRQCGTLNWAYQTSHSPS